VLNDNGAWSWFQDERAVVDARGGVLLVSSVANGAGSGGSVRHGNVEVVAHDLESEEAHRTVLHANFEADDHDSAALFVRPDGRYVAVYSRHNTDGLTRWRVSLGSGSETRWGPEQTFDHGAGTTYSNLYSTPEVGDRLYNFVRSAGRDPHFVVSDDDGSTWRFGGRLLDGPGRPYVRYAIDGIGRIHLVTTEQHPHDFGNSVYHGVIDDGQLQRSDGAPVDTDLYDGVAVDPTSLTKVFAGDDRHRAWTVDLQVDTAGLPYAAFSVRSPVGHRYHYARFDGVRWRVHLLGHAGRGLYADEPDYTGLVALDPRDPSRLVISTDAHPVTGRPLISGRDRRRHYELFEGVTIDDGATWSWTALTADSTVDNIRPIIPVGDAAHAAVLWLRGTYHSYKVYDLDVVGVFSSAEPYRLPGDVSLAETSATMPRPRRQRACRPRRIRDGEYRRAHPTPGGPKFM
jgi:hypothetical protein